MFACWHACVNAWTNADKVLMCELLQTLKCTQTHTFSWAHLHLLSACMCVCACVCVRACERAHMSLSNTKIQSQMSSYQPMTNLHLCVGSVLLHMWELALIPQPLHYHPPPEALPEPLTDWWENLAWQKKLKWLITEAHLSTWGSRLAKRGGAQEGAPLLGLSTWHPGADSPVHGSV